jgi:hypothetical protein
MLPHGLHELGHALLRPGRQQQMEVIGHEHIGMHIDLEAPRHLAHQIQHDQAILRVHKISPLLLPRWMMWCGMFASVRRGRRAMERTWTGATGKAFRSL